MRTVGIYPGKNALEEQYEEQYDEGYFGRVYRTSVVVFGIGAVMLYGRGGLPALIGFTYGAAVSLASLRAIELFARHFLRPERHLNRARIAMLMVLKLPVLGLVLSGAAGRGGPGPIRDLLEDDGSRAGRRAVAGAGLGTACDRGSGAGAPVGSGAGARPLRAGRRQGATGRRPRAAGAAGGAAGGRLK